MSRSTHTHTPLSSRYVYARARAALHLMWVKVAAHTRKEMIFIMPVFGARRPCVRTSPLTFSYSSSGSRVVIATTRVYTGAVRIYLYIASAFRAPPLFLLCVYPRAPFLHLSIYTRCWLFWRSRGRRLFPTLSRSCESSSSSPASLFFSTRSLSTSRVVVHFWYEFY